MATPPLSWKRVLATNSAGSFATIIPKTTKPLATTEGVYDIISEDTLAIILFGAGDADQAVGCKVIGWRCVKKAEANDLWVPVVIAHLAGTLGTAVGVAGAACVATDKFADAIAVTTPANAIDSVTPTVTANTVATTRITISGYEKIQLDFDKSTATNANALIALYSTEN